MALLRPVFTVKAVRDLAGRGVTPGPTADERAQTVTHVWGEVRDDRGRTAVSRLHGPEAGVEWTARAALAAVRRIAAGDAAPGFRTPALAFGADFALEADGVTREDLD
jgi:saccharopine dehydrogenase (NAD+, L-lysine-forming)